MTRTELTTRLRMNSVNAHTKFVPILLIFTLNFKLVDLSWWIIRRISDRNSNLFFDFFLESIE